MVVNGLSNWLRFLIPSIFFSIPLLVFAAPAQLVFLTPEISVPAGEISSQITLQLQNSSGEEEKATETYDLLFESNSPTGEFLNSTGGPVTDYISRNTANKNFYYKDPSVGSFNILVTATGRDSGHILQASGRVIVGGAVLSENTTSINSTTQNNQTTSASASTHTSMTVLSSSPEVNALYASAGRARVSAVGLPVEFNGWVSETKTGQAVEEAIYDWTFGDGGFDGGREVSHSYRDPGEYVVVLRAYYSNKEAVARTTVSVVDFDTRVVNVLPGVNGYIEIKNFSNSEVNLGQVALRQGSYQYAFPKDTILLPGRSIRVYRDVLRFTPTSEAVNVILPYGRNPSLPVLSIADPIDKTTEVSKNIILDLSKKIDTIEQQANNIRKNDPTSSQTFSGVNQDIEIAMVEDVAKKDDQVAVLEIKPRLGLWQKLIGLFGLN